MKREAGFNTCLGFIGWYDSYSPTWITKKLPWQLIIFWLDYCNSLHVGDALKNHTSAVLCTKCLSLIIGQHYSSRADYTCDLVNPLLPLDFHMKFKILVWLLIPSMIHTDLSELAHLAHSSQEKLLLVPGSALFQLLLWLSLSCALATWFI